jgi:hypothetical protein
MPIGSLAAILSGHPWLQGLARKELNPAHHVQR